MPVRRYSRRRRPRTRRYSRRPVRRPRYVPIGTEPHVRVKLQQVIHVKLQEVLSAPPQGPYVAFYVYFGFPANTPYIGTNYQSRVDSIIGWPYPDFYGQYYNRYQSFIQLGMSWKCDFLRESFPSSVNTLCAVSAYTQGMMNGSVSDWPFQDYATWWASPNTRVKWQRGINENTGDGCIVSIKGKITGNKLHGENVMDGDRFRSTCPAPGAANSTPANINQALSPGSTAGVGTIAFLQTVPSGQTGTIKFADLMVTLVHDLYFFDPRPIPLSSF